MGKETILILGGNGFSGVHFIKYLIKVDTDNKYKIISVDLTLPKNNTYASVTYIKKDISDKGSLLKLLKENKSSIIINFIGLLRSKSIDDYYKINVKTSQILFEYAKNNRDVKKILIIGSAAEYGIPLLNPVKENDELNPINLYGLSKVIQTQIAKYYAKAFDVPVVIARTFNLRGEGITKNLAIGNWQYLIDNANDNSTIKFGNLEASRDYLTVEEVVEYYWILIKYGISGGIYNVCSGKPVKMRKLLEQMIVESGKKITIESDPSLFKSDDLPIIYGDNSKLLSLK